MFWALWIRNQGLTDGDGAEHLDRKVLDLSQSKYPEKKIDFVTSSEVVLSDSEAGIAQVTLELTVMLSAGIPLW